MIFLICDTLILLIKKILKIKKNQQNLSDIKLVK